MLFAVNYSSVFIYGLLIMVFLLDIKFNKKNLIVTSFYVIISVIFHLILFYIWGAKFLEKIYPFAVHLPLLVFCILYFKRRLDSVFFVLFTAYILTTPRRWIGDLVALAFHSEPSITAIIQIIVSFPLLYIIYKYLRPYIIKIMDFSDVKIRFLLIIPLIYYVTTYLTTVYTDLLYTSKVVVIGILTTGLACTFYYFIVVYFNEMIKRFEIRNEQNILAVQISALQARSETMKQAEHNAIIHRHDLRHHLHLINGYLAKNNIQDAQSYISEIEKSMYDSVTVKYCDNDAVNLILSSYFTMAKNKHITVQSQVDIPKNCQISDMDLCVILANAIENAINACVNIKDTTNRILTVSCATKNNKLLIQVINSFTGEVNFDHDIPVTDKENHGFGTKSIVAAVQKYHGVYSFAVEDGVFKVNVIL